MKQIGRDLGVRYVLEGSVRKAGNRVRITGQLIDATDGHILGRPLRWRARGYLRASGRDHPQHYRRYRAGNCRSGDSARATARMQPSLANGSA